MSTNTWAVDRERKRVFDLGNHSTPLVPKGEKTIRYDREALKAAKDNVRVVNARVSYGVDSSGKFAVDQCLAWMKREDIEIVVLVMEGGHHPWETDDLSYSLHSDWTYLTPFSHPYVRPDPYTLHGEIYFHDDEVSA